jgi:hypothetical protein
MKTKYSVLLSLAAFMIIFFQNCGKPPTVSSNGDSSTPSQTFNKYEVNGFQTISVWDEPKQRFLDVDINSGSVQAFEQAGRVPGATYQLGDIELSQLKSILQKAEVCEPLAQEHQKNMACTMIYVYPYATLVSPNQQMKLGEKMSGCDIPVDLCGDKSAQLKAWSQGVVEGL